MILDEPFRGLDPLAAVVMRRIMVSWPLAEDRACLVATHDLDAAERLCDRVFILAGGRIIAAGIPSQMLESSGASSLEQHFIEVSGLRSALDETERILEVM